MATRLLPKTKNKYILSVFKQACETAIFHDKWMTADTWADAICLHYQLSEGIAFDGTALSTVIASNISLCLAVDSPKDDIKSDHCGVFATASSSSRQNQRKRFDATMLQ